MRRPGGVALIALGVLSVLLGCLLAVAFGPDDKMSTGPHRLTSSGSAIVTAPEALAYAGPPVELTVTSTDPGRDIFVGVGHDVDVRDLLGDTPRLRVETISIPWEISTQSVGGSGVPKSDPGQVDWWIAEEQGRGRVVLDWDLPDVAADVVILDEDGRDRLTVDVTAALEVPGIFVVGLASVVLGLGIVVFGWAVLTTRVTPPGTHAHRQKALGGTP